MVSAELIDDIKNKIVENFDPERIILFGSHAEGRAGRDSDIDLFVEMESDLTPPERAIRISKFFGIREWPMDLFVYTPDEVRKLRGRVGTLLYEIEDSGKVLYERKRN